MTYPKMIIFDYGHTLLCEPGWDTARGNAALMEYAVKNENHCTVEDVVKHADIVFKEHIEQVRALGYDISDQVSNRFLYDYLGIEFSLTPLEMETVFWNGTSKGAVMPNADKMLDYINEKCIRSAVISNLCLSGEALAERLNRLLPNNQFEFVITSSDYMFRKPNRLLFELALRKAGLDAAEVWYCGDNPQVDVEGAAQTGIFPIWYDNALECEYRDKSKEPLPQCEYLLIHEWDEMIEVLEGLKNADKMGN